jgi:ABC-2 type transport system ATP-binding protein
MSMTDLVLQANDLGKVYRKRTKRVSALKDLSFDLPRGEVFGFLGPNGAGKSTTIKILTGQIRATSGQAQLLGHPVGTVAARQRLGYLPENPSFYDFLSGREYLRFIARCFSLEHFRYQSRIDEVLMQVDLSMAADRAIRTYSKGMVQRLGIAQTLVHDPELFIFDEPMSGLDPMGRALVKEIIKDLKRAGKTVFFSTHITSDVEEVCDRLGVIVAGRLRVLDSVDNILRDASGDCRVQVVDAAGELQSVTIAQAKLQPELERLWAAGARIERIEPQRQNLESFFLDVVNRAVNED